MYQLIEKYREGFWPSTKVSGVLLFAMWALTLSATFGFSDTVGLATIFAWIFVLIELPRLKPNQRNQISVLAAVGIGFSCWAWWQGSTVSLLSLLDEHIKLAMLLTAVSFISLAMHMERDESHRGFKSFFLTLSGMHLFSSVANFSSVVLVGEQVKRNATVDKLSQIILARGFSLAVLWSPFLSIIPLVLEQVPGAQIYDIYPFSITLAVTGLLYTLMEARFRSQHELVNYEGYPLKTTTLRLPVLMIITILLCAWYWPQLPTVAMVSSLAIIVPLVVASALKGVEHGVKTLGHHIGHKLADTRAEISLFLSAGVLAGGVKAAIAEGLISLPFTETNALVASAVMTIIVLLAMLGIHQLALVAIFAGLLADVTTTPTLMALAYILATALSMSGSIFSGLSFILRARFNCSSTEIHRNNLPYTLSMLAFGSLILFIMEWLGVA